ncbi:MAG: OmpA family protein [Acidimicrobiales bacterium]
MGELEELPSWAGRSTDAEQVSQPSPLQQEAAVQPPLEPTQPQGRRPWKIAMLALFGIAALLGMGVLGYVLADQGNSTETATDDTDAQSGQLGSEELTSNDALTSTDGAEAEGTDADEAITVDVDGSDDDAAMADEDDAATDDDAAAAEAATDDDAAADETEASDEDDATGDSTDSGRLAIFKGGKVYLSGPVPSEEVGQFIEQKAAAVVGPDNVVNEYTIDPTEVIVPGSSAPLYVEDVVLFGFNSIEVATPFFPILDLGTLLLRQNPQASITVITRTDAVGSAEVNLDVSRKRAQAIIDYWVKSGVDPAQINADPRGEEEASEDDDEQTASLNRRAEFIIIGLLD